MALKHVHERQVDVRQVDRIPSVLLQAYQRELMVTDNNVQQAAEAEVKLVAYQGRKAVGFISTTPLEMIEPHQDTVLAGSAIFVREGVRGRGVGSMLVNATIKEAEKQGLDGVDICFIQPETEWMLEGLEQKLQARKPTPVKLTLFEDPEGTRHAELRFEPKTMRDSRR